MVPEVYWFLTHMELNSAGKAINMCLMPTKYQIVRRGITGSDTVQGD